MNRAELLQALADIIPGCSNYVASYDCERVGRDIDSPYSADGYCLPCRLWVVLRAEGVERP